MPARRFTGPVMMISTLALISTFFMLNLCTQETAAARYYRSVRYYRSSYYRSYYYYRSGPIYYRRYYSSIVGAYMWYYVSFYRSLSYRYYMGYRTRYVSGGDKCANMETNSNGSYMGTFTCPAFDSEPDSFIYCCGYQNEEFCCPSSYDSSWAYGKIFFGLAVWVIAVIGVIGTGVVFAIIAGFLVYRYKHRQRLLANQRTVTLRNSAASTTTTTTVASTGVMYPSQGQNMMYTQPMYAGYASNAPPPYPTPNYPPGGPPPYQEGQNGVAGYGNPAFQPAPTDNNAWSTDYRMFQTAPGNKVPM